VGDGETGHAESVGVAWAPVTVQAWFESSTAEVEPGSSVVLVLGITNLGATTDSFSLAPTGLAAAWTTVRPPYITLFGGAQATVEVEVEAPRLPTTTAGPVALGVRVVPHGDPDDVEMTEITLDVAPTFDRRITLLQPARRSRRRAVFEMLLENLGNTQATCQMHLIDPTGRIDGRLDPAAIGVEPGGTGLVRLKAVATRRQWERSSRTIAFRVEADQQGAPTAAASGTFVQAPMVPDRIIARLVGPVLAAGLVALAWFAVVRPAIDDAAADAVAQRPAPTVTTVPPPTTDGADTGTDTGTGTGTALGTPLSTVLTSGGPAGETSSQQYTVPAGQTLLLSDYLVQNPFGDAGMARLRIGERELEWDLAVHLDGIDVSNRLVTPLAVGAGESITFEVDCSAVGQEGGTGCSASALVVGRLVPA